MIKCHYDATTGEVKGLYAEELYKTFPEPNINISPELARQIVKSAKPHRLNFQTNEFEQFTPVLSDAEKRDKEKRFAEINLSARQLERIEAIEEFLETLGYQVDQQIKDLKDKHRGR